MAILSRLSVNTAVNQNKTRKQMYNQIMAHLIAYATRFPNLVILTDILTVNVWPRFELVTHNSQFVAVCEWFFELFVKILNH